MPSTTRQALLQALSAAGGAYISGQQLAGQLGVSRAAVHKAAAALTAQGYALEAVSRRGYRLLGGDPFCGKLQPDGQAAGAGRCAPRHAGAHSPPERRPGTVGPCI